MVYIACDVLSLDSSDYSFAYVTRRSDSELVKETAERVIGCANTIVVGLDVDPGVIAW